MEKLIFFLFKYMYNKCMTNIKWFALNDEGGDNNEEVDKN